MSGLRAARELADMSQTELARRMVAKGFNWSQMTVSRREENENTLRWREGIALRDIIGYPAFTPDFEIAKDAITYRAMRKIFEDRERVDDLLPVKGEA